MLRLLVNYRREEQVFAVPEGDATLGRALENNIVLRIPGVSRRHALLRRCPGGIEVVDQKSKNGILVGGARVDRTVLTPGLRLQVGSAWLEVEEVSSMEEALLRLLSDSSESGLPSLTAAVRPGADPKPQDPCDAALALAYYIAQVGVGRPDERADLLFRIKATLGAEAFGTLEKTPRGQLRVMESAGGFSSSEVKALASLARDMSVWTRDQVILKRGEHLLLAGRQSWFLAARFAEEDLAREQWRKEFLQFLAFHFFMPVRSLKEVELVEASRVLALTRGNKKRASKLLGISRVTLYSILDRILGKN